MPLKWLAKRLGRGANRKKQTAREKARRNRLGRKIQFEHLESRTLLSASIGSLHTVSAAIGKLTGPAVLSTHTTGSTGPAAPTGGQTSGQTNGPTSGSPGGSTSGATPPTLSTAAAATLSVHILPPPPPAGAQGSGGPGGPGGGQGSSSSGSGQSSSSTPIATPSVITGTTITVCVQALDANGVPTSNYSGTASVTCSDSSVTVPATLTFKNGVATFQVTVGAIGTETFTVTDTTTATITGTTTIDVVAAPKAMQYGVNILSPPPNSMGSGSSGTGSGSTGLTSGTGTSQLPPPPPGQGGSSSMGSSGSGSNQLPPPPPPPPPPSGTTPNVTAGTTVTVQVVALDAKGNPVPNYTGTATVASSDTSVTVPSSIMFTDGVATFQVTLSTAESETLTVTSSDGTIDGSVTVNVVAATTSSSSTSSSQSKSAAAVVASTSKTSATVNMVKPTATVKPVLLRK